MTSLRQLIAALGLLLAAPTALAQPATPTTPAGTQAQTSPTQTPASPSTNTVQTVQSVQSVQPQQLAPPIPDAQVFEDALIKQPVFGQSLFRGRFAQESFRGFNPDYLLSVGDLIDIRMWGAYETAMQLQVDAQGNIFLPKLGPITVLGVRNAELNNLVQERVRNVYRSDVGVYATLVQSVPVQIYVAGFAVAPGLYPGFASDSVLTFLDRAGGVNPISGSYLDVRLLRNGQTLQTINLYRFITEGTLPAMQLQDGDTLFVGPIGPTVLISGLVTTPAQYEIADGASLADMLKLSGLSPRATHVRVTRNSGARRQVFYVGRDDALLQSPTLGGDEIEVTADRLLGAIAVSVEGEHEGAGQYILPYDASLQDLIDQIQLSRQSAVDSLQLYRVSVAERQKQVLTEMLQKLEQSVLSARSATTEEAELRTREAELVLQFIDRARAVKPRGQVILANDFNPSTIALEDGDVVRIPRSSNLVAVHGEVYLPNSFVWKRGHDVRDYIKMSGGVIQRSAEDRILLVRQSGEVVTGYEGGFLRSHEVLPGDEIMVLPAVDPKRFQFTRDIVQIMYQSAIAAGVLLRL